MFAVKALPQNFRELSPDTETKRKNRASCVLPPSSCASNSNRNLNPERWSKLRFLDFPV